MDEPTVLKDATPANARWRQWWGKAVAVIVLLTASAATYWVGNAVKPSTGPAEGLVVDEKTLDIGEVWESKSFSHTLKIRNPTGHAIVIEGFLVSCNCVSFRPSSLQILAGGTGEVLLVMDLTEGERRNPKSPVKEVAVGISPRVVGNGVVLRSLPQWVVRGKAKPVLSLSQRELLFAERLVHGKGRLPSRTILISPATPVQRIEVKTSKPLLATRLAPLRDRPNQFELRVTPLESAPSGRLDCDLLLTAIDKTGKPLPPVTLPVVGQIEDQVQAAPSTILFGLSPVGSLQEATFALNSVEGDPFDIEAIDTPDGTVVEPVGVQERSVKRFRVKQRVAARGPQNPLIRFEIRVQGQRKKLVVETSYQGYNRSGGGGGD